MKKFKTDILIRDNLVDYMKGRGALVDYETLSDEEYLIELKKKIIEEAGELLKATTIENIKEEIADVREVLEHLVSFYKFDEKELDDVKRRKQEKNGKFDKKIKTNFVEVDENNPYVDYYLSRPEKYPEIV